MENWPINPVDLIVILLILLSAVLALARGFVREFMSLVTWSGAAAASVFAFPHLQAFWRAQIEADLFADAANFAATFVGAMIVLPIISHLISQLVRGRVLGSIDRSIGFIFGAMRGALIVCLVYLVFGWFIPPDKMPDWAKEARTTPLLASGAEALKAYIPEAQFKMGEQKMGADEIKKAAEGAVGILPKDAAAESGTTPAPNLQKDDAVQKELQELNKLLQRQTAP